MLCKVNRQPISASENGENFLDQLKGEIFCVRTDTNIESFGKGTMIFHLMRIRILNLNYADSDPDPTFLFDKEPDTDPDILV